MTAEPHMLPERLLRAAMNLEIWSLALPALEALSERQIPILVLKSLPQVEELYGDVAGRYTGDVDVVVPACHAREALTCIINAGWKLQEQRWFDLLSSLHGPQTAASMRSWHFLREAGDRVCTIDLHSDGMERWRHPVLNPTIWKRAQSRTRDGVDFLVLGPEDRLIFLCWHFFADARGALGIPWHKLPDIARAVERNDIDWNYVRARAGSLGVVLFVSLACELAMGGSDAEIAPEWRRLKSPAGRWRQAAVRRALSGDLGSLGTRRRHALWLLAHDRLLDTVPAWRRVIIPDRTTIAADYLGTWPTSFRYLVQVAKIYWQRLLKSF